MLTGNWHDADDLVQGALLRPTGRWSVARRRPEGYTRAAVLVNLARIGGGSGSTATLRSFQRPDQRQTAKQAMTEALGTVPEPGLSDCRRLFILLVVVQ